MGGGDFLGISATIASVVMRSPATEAAPCKASLADYLERKGLLSQTSADDSYDPDGFFLDQGPNKKKKKPVPEDDFFFF